MNAASIPGRTLPMIVSDTVGPLNIQAPFAVISGILAFSWLAVSDLSGLLAVCILYAVASGGFLSMPPAAVASLTPDLSRFGARMGVILAFMSLGSLVGNPVSQTQECSTKVSMICRRPKQGLKDQSDFEASPPRHGQSLS